MSQEMLQEDARLLWADLLDEAQSRGLDDLLVWLGRAQPATFDGATMCLVTRQKWAARNLMGKYRETLEGLMQEITMEPVALDVQVEDAGETPAPASAQAGAPAQAGVQACPAAVAAVAPAAASVPVPTAMPAMQQSTIPENPASAPTPAVQAPTSMPAAVNPATAAQAIPAYDAPAQMSVQPSATAPSAAFAAVPAPVTATPSTMSAVQVAPEVDGLTPSVQPVPAAPFAQAAPEAGVPVTVAPAAVAEPAPQASLSPAPAVVEQPEPQGAGLSAAALAGRAAAHGHAPIRSRLFQTAGQDQGLSAQTSAPQQLSNTFSTASAPNAATPAAPAAPTSPVTPIPVLEDGVEQKDEVKAQSGTDFTFDTYIVGESNRIAYNLARAVAEQPDGSMFNPLFIWGPSGNGKTHLLLSIRDYIACHQPQTQALYIPANAFVTQFIDEIRNRKLRGNEVLRAYRDVDVLLVDDVQFFEDKQDSVTAFFDIFNEMMLSGGKQIVLAADRAPDYLRLDPRMRTRFGQGMVADIKAPTWEMKVSILKSFYERLRQRNGMSGVTLSDRALELMADHCPDNPRQMAGLINNVMFNAEVDPSILTEDGLRGAIDSMFKQVAVINLDRIMDVVAKESGVTKEQMASDSRVKQVKEARQLVMWLASQLTDEPYTSIGGALSRDHSTVSHGIKKVNERRETDRGYMHMLEDLKNKVMQ